MEKKSKKVPVIIGIVVVICVIAAAIVWAGMKKNGSIGSSEETKEVLEEKRPWEEADVTGIDGAVCTIAGTVEGTELALPDKMSFYIEDGSGQKYFFKEVTHVALIGGEKLGKLDGRELTVTGTVVCGNNVVYMTPETMETEDGIVELSEEGIHRYEFVVKDCSWTQAFQESLDRGGYLIHINSREEYDHILQKIGARGYQKIHFYLGGRREDNGQDYCWVDEQNQLYGDPLNSADAWCSPEWLAGEPSYEDTSLGISEAYLNIFYMQNRNGFVWSDGPDNIPAAVPAFSGKIGYIVEFEE